MSSASSKAVTVRSVSRSFNLTVRAAPDKPSLFVDSAA
jgi:hypothetical protein